MPRRTKPEPIPPGLPVLRSIAMELGHSEPVIPAGRDPFRRPMSQSEWLAAAAAFRASAGHTDRLRFAFLAQGVREGLLWTDEVMDRYCAATCPHCDDPCCSADGIYYDRADLLYLIGLDADLPMSQIRERAGAPCRYLAAEGCILPRMCRPFICTWYLCEPQMALLEAEPLPFQKQFTAIMQAVRRCRLQLLALAAAVPADRRA